MGFPWYGSLVSRWSVQRVSHSTFFPGLGLVLFHLLIGCSMQKTCTWHFRPEFPVWNSCTDTSAQTFNRSAASNTQFKMVAVGNVLKSESLGSCLGSTRWLALGDWNAKVGSQEIPGVTGKFGLGIQNEAGQRLIEFCWELTGHSKQQQKRQLQYHKRHKRQLYPWTSFDGQNQNHWLYSLQPKMEKF